MCHVLPCHITAGLTSMCIENIPANPSFAQKISDGLGVANSEALEPIHNRELQRAGVAGEQDHLGASIGLHRQSQAEEKLNK